MFCWTSISNGHNADFKNCFSNFDETDGRHQRIIFTVEGYQGAFTGSFEWKGRTTWRYRPSWLYSPFSFPFQPSLNISDLVISNPFDPYGHHAYLISGWEPTEPILGSRTLNIRRSQASYLLYILMLLYKINADIIQIISEISDSGE